MIRIKAEAEAKVAKEQLEREESEAKAKAEAEERAAKEQLEKESDPVNQIKKELAKLRKELDSVDD